MCQNSVKRPEKLSYNVLPPTESGLNRQGWFNGVLQAIPIMLGYVPIGFAYGVLAQKAGLSPGNTVLMSLLVYAGSSQLIAVGLFAMQVPPASIIMTTLVVNLRHLLMASAIAPFLKRWHKGELAVFAYQLTDETFALHSTRFPSGIPGKAEVFATNMTAQASWVTGTVLGIVAGQLITDVKPFALDYALPAMFVALLVFQIKNRIQILVALLTGVIAIVFVCLGMSRWYMLTATVIGATIGVVIEQWIKPASS
jgi:4-azaleucine resistance transporter AzlC